MTPPLSEDTTVLGAGRVDVWVRSSVPDVMLQATISEVRPDGKETFVQGGWVRTFARALDPASPELEPMQSFLLEDYAPMPTDRYEKVTIPLYYEGHAYRAGSQIRVRISAPNGDQPIWSFSETVPATGRPRSRSATAARPRRACSSRWCRGWTHRPGSRPAPASAASRAATTSPS